MTSIARTWNSTSARVIAGYVSVAIVLAGAWLYSLYGPLTSAVVAQQERNLTAVAQSAALAVSESDLSPQQVAMQLVARTDLRLTIVAADGTVLADSDRAPSTMQNHAGRPEIRAALAGRTGLERRTSATEGFEQIYVAAPGSLAGKTVAVRVSQSLEEVRGIAGDLRRFGLLLLAVALAVAVVIALRVTRAAAQPIAALSDAAREMAEGNLSARIPAAPADLEPLAKSLSTLKRQMSSRLDALETERQTLRAALDGLADAVIVVEDGRVAVANRAAVGLLKVTEPGIEGLELEQTSLPASLKAAIRNQRVTPSAEGLEMEPDPTGRAWRVFLAPLSAGDVAKRFVVVIADVTQRARLDRVRREFVANASHELKTPVAGIKLLIESAAMASSDGDDERAAAFCEQIAGEVGRLQRLVNDLLDLSRLESLPAADSMADVRVAVDNALAGHRSAASRKGLALLSDFLAVRDEDVFVAADPTDVAVALDNLVDNAINYTQVGSVTVAVAASDAVVTISVTDTGSGIAVEHLPRIFERFYRVDGSRSRDRGGTGLGLALVRHVTERNGGEVAVTSDIGEGSSFALSLPRHR